MLRTLLLLVGLLSTAWVCIGKRVYHPIEKTFFTQNYRGPTLAYLENAYPRIVTPDYLKEMTVSADEALACLDLTHVDFSHDAKSDDLVVVVSYKTMYTHPCITAETMTAARQIDAPKMWMPWWIAYIHTYSPELYKTMKSVTRIYLHTVTRRIDIQFGCTVSQHNTETMARNLTVVAEQAVTAACHARGDDWNAIVPRYLQSNGVYTDILHYLDMHNDWNSIVNANTKKTAHYPTTKMAGISVTYLCGEDNTATIRVVKARINVNPIRHESPAYDTFANGALYSLRALSIFDPTSALFQRSIFQRIDNWAVDSLESEQQRRFNATNDMFYGSAPLFLRIYGNMTKRELDACNRTIQTAIFHPTLSRHRSRLGRHMMQIVLPASFRKMKEIGKDLCSLLTDPSMLAMEWAPQQQASTPIWRFLTQNGFPLSDRIRKTVRMAIGLTEKGQHRQLSKLYNNTLDEDRFVTEVHRVKHTNEHVMRMKTAHPLQVSTSDWQWWDDEYDTMRMRIPDTISFPFFFPKSNPEFLAEHERARIAFRSYNTNEDSSKVLMASHMNSMRDQKGYLSVQSFQSMKRFLDAMLNMQTLNPHYNNTLAATLYKMLS